MRRIKTASSGVASSIVGAGVAAVSLLVLIQSGRCFVGAWLFAAATAHAEIVASTVTAGRRVPLNPGMSFSQVQARWGEPKEKIEYELRREAIWKYSQLKYAPAVTLRFSKGVLSSQEIDSSPLNSNYQRSNSKMENDTTGQEAQQLKRQIKKDRPDKKPTSFMALSDQKMLSEILKEVPNEPETGDKAVSGRNPAVPAQIE